MELSNVLTQYLELVQSDVDQIKFHMASNGAIDWFGKTVRGPHKIQDYLRNEVCSQYDHIEFEKAEPCDPIETKPTHMKTKALPTAADIDPIHPTNRVTGLTSLKSYADSDVEDDDDMEMRSGVHNKTPEKFLMNNSVIEELTPPSSIVKKDSASAFDSEDDEEELMETKAKRLKLMHPYKPFSYLKRLPTTATTALKRKMMKHDEIRTLLDDTSSDEDDDADKKIDGGMEYTALRYLTATGVLRSQAHHKHRGMGLMRLTSTTTTPSTGTATHKDLAGSWDREVRIQISYRKRLADQQIQFALIIYKHQDRLAAKAQSRRNLMTEFSQTSSADNDNEGPHDDDLSAIDAMADDNATAICAEEQPAVIINASDETIVATVETPSSAEIATALESAAFTIVPLRTPTKVIHTPPPTPKRKARLPPSMSGLKRLNLSPSSSSSSTSTPKRNAARSLRL